MILSAQTLRKLRPVDPFVERTVFKGMSYGLSNAGYDIRLRENVWIGPGEFHLASSIERFTMPRNVLGRVHDKSSWARKGLSVFNTIIEPGWEGFLTLELVNHSDHHMSMDRGVPIAQVVFEYIDDEAPAYAGKYQNAPAWPQGSLFETGGLPPEFVDALRERENRFSNC